jgi:hypothetical protein
MNKFLQGKLLYSLPSNTAIQVMKNEIFKLDQAEYTVSSSIL